MSRGYDRYTTMFSPDGRLYQVEYSYKAARACDSTGVGWISGDSGVLVSTKKVPDKLINPASISSLYSVTKEIGMLVMGRPSDCRTLVYKAREFAHEFFYSNGYEIPVSFLAKKIANHVQFYTQHAYRRVYGCEALFLGCNDAGQPTIFTVSPSGFWSPCKAYAVGQKQKEVKHYLEKKLKEETLQDMNLDITVEESILSLLNATGNDGKSGDLDAMVIDMETKKIRKLTEDEIDARLTAIQERD